MVIVCFLPSFKDILTGYTTREGLRRLGRAISNRKGFGHPNKGRSVLLTTDDNPLDHNEYLRSIDEMPKFVESPNYGTTSIEHYIRRLVTYLARVQSVTQSIAKGLTLRVCVKLDTKEWLRMYARLRNACEPTSCVHLPDPVMLTAAALAKDELDLVTEADVDDEMRTVAMRSISSLRNGLGLAGRADAVTARSQTTMLAMDFDIVAKTRSNTHTLWENLRNKRWYDLRRVTPDCSGNFSLALRSTLAAMRSMESMVNMIWPFSDVGTGSNIRSEIQGALKAMYVDPIIEIARMTSTAPIVNINHDLRLVGAGNRVLQKSSENFHGFHARGADIAREDAWWYTVPRFSSCSAKRWWQRVSWTTTRLEHGTRTSKPERSTARTSSRSGRTRVVSMFRPR